MRRFISLAKLNREATERQAQTRRAKEEEHKAKINWWNPINWNWTALSTCVIAGFTILIYCVGVNQWRTFQGQLAVMQGQLDEMKADQRPWISNDIEAASDLTFDDSGGILRFRYTLRNIGRSPAFNVNAWPIILRSTPSPNILVTDPTRILKEHCIDVERKIKDLLQGDFCRRAPTPDRGGTAPHLASV